MKKKAHKGRPKKVAKMKRIVVAISLYAEHQKRLKAIAKKLGMSESEAVRMLIERYDR